MPDLCSKNCLSKSIRSVDRLASGHYNSYLKELGLKITQYTVISAIYEMGSVSSSDLEETLKLDQTTVSRTLKNLQREKLIKVELAEDLRKKIFTLTSEGHELYKKAFAAWKDAQENLLEKVGENVANQFLEINEYIIQEIRKVV